MLHPCVWLANTLQLADKIYCSTVPKLEHMCTGINVTIALAHLGGTTASSHVCSCYALSGINRQNQTYISSDYCQFVIYIKGVKMFSTKTSRDVGMVSLIK